MKYIDITENDLGTKRQRPMYLSAFTEFRAGMNMRTYPHDPHDYCKNVFLPEIDSWVKSHKRAQYLGLEEFPIHHVILGVTHQLDELHMLQRNNISVFEGEYKYHDRLPTFVRKLINKTDIMPGEHVVISAPSTITTNVIPNMEEILDYELGQNYPNPVKDLLIIDSKVKIIKVEMYSVLGKKVLEKKSNFNQIQTNGISHGVYIVKIYSEDGFIFKKIIKS